MPTPALRLSPRATPEWKRVQPLSRGLVPESKPCVEVSPTISSWNCSASRTNSGSFPNRQGVRLRLLPFGCYSDPVTTRPLVTTPPSLQHTHHLHNETSQSRPHHKSDLITTTTFVTTPPPSQHKMRRYNPILVTTRPLMTAPPPSQHRPPHHPTPRDNSAAVTPPPLVTTPPPSQQRLS